MSVPPVVGIFVGGRGTRMGGVAKGFLRRPDGRTIIEHLITVAVEAGAEPVLVGQHPAYAHLGLTMLDDAPSGVGPKGGLVALLTHAGDRLTIALGGDMPFVTADFLRALLRHAPDAAIVAPRRGGVWEPLLARYSPRAVLAVARGQIAQKSYSMQALLDAAEAEAIEAPSGSEARDWDTPDDVVRDGGR